MLKPNFRPERRVLAQFAWFAVVGLPLIAWAALRVLDVWSWTHPAFLAAAGVGVLQLAAFLAGLEHLSRWLFVGLMVLVLPIGFVLSHVLMAATFYLVFTPIGLIFRLIGRDAMGRKLEPGRASYWHDRGPARGPASYFKLY